MASTEVRDTKVVTILFDTNTLRQFLHVVNGARIPSPADPDAYLEFGISYYETDKALFEIRNIWPGDGKK